MKSTIFLLFIFLFCRLNVHAQSITDTGALRTYINTHIITNGNRTITGGQMNIVLNGILNIFDNLDTSTGGGTSGIHQVIAAYGLSNINDSIIQADSASLANYFLRRKDSLTTYSTPKQIHDSIITLMGGLTGNELAIYNSSTGGLQGNSSLTYSSGTLTNGSISLASTGAGTFGTAGSTVSIPAPVNLGYARSITLDQPNTQVIIKDGNADNGGGITRPSQNGGEFRVFSKNTNTAGVTKGYITFYVNDGSTLGASVDTSGYLHSFISLNISDSTDKVATTKWARQRTSLSQILTDGATISMDCSNGYNAFITLGGNRNITFSNVEPWKPITIEVIQDATGNRTLTFPANTLIPLGFGSATTVNLTTTTGAIDVLYVIYDGANYLVTMAKNFVN